MLNKQSLDFYLPKYNIAIECQGEQHFIANFFKSKGIDFVEEHLKYIQGLDEKKKKICKENNIKMIYFLDKKFNKYVDENTLRVNTEKELIGIIEDIKNKENGTACTKDN